MKPTENHERSDATAIEAEAMAWLAEREEGFAPGRAAAFESWRRRDRRHAAPIMALQAVNPVLEPSQIKPLQLLAISNMRAYFSANRHLPFLRFKPQFMAERWKRRAT